MEHPIRRERMSELNKVDELLMYIQRARYQLANKRPQFAEHVLKQAEDCVKKYIRTGEKE
jgi:hypothetical protein